MVGPAQQLLLTQKAAVRTPTLCVLQQRVARAVVKLATLEPTGLDVVRFFFWCVRVLVLLLFYLFMYIFYRRSRIHTRKSFHDALYTYMRTFQ